MSNYHVITPAGAVVRIYDDKTNAIAFASEAEQRGTFQGLTVQRVKVVTRETRSTVWTAPKADPSAIQAAQDQMGAG